MRARLGGVTLAVSDAAREVGGYVYFPPESVSAGCLVASPQTAHDLACPHGVRFYDVVARGRVAERAAWIYEAPRAPFEDVRDWVGFWRDIQILT